MSFRYLGGVRSATANTPSGVSAPGVWTQQARFQASTWPGLNPLPYVTPLLDGTLILSGYGLMIYKTGFGDLATTTANFVVPANCTKIRAIAIGAGGGASGSENVVGAQGGAGIEAFITVTPGETLTVGVGLGGSGTSGGVAGKGGNSYIKRGSVTLIQGNGGLNTGSTNSASGLSRSTSSYDAGVTVISRGAGGTGGQETYTPQSDFNAISVSVALSGAVAHAGGAGGWQSFDNTLYGLGLGFGGGGGWAGSGSLTRAGGIYGYIGGSGSNGGGQIGGGPVGGWANDTNSSSGYSGGGGGSFGGSGVDGWSGGYGAGGLVRIWWASSAGDPNWINTGANYGS